MPSTTFRIKAAPPRIVVCSRFRWGARERGQGARVSGDIFWRWTRTRLRPPHRRNVLHDLSHYSSIVTVHSDNALRLGLRDAPKEQCCRTELFETEIPWKDVILSQ